MGLEILDPRSSICSSRLGTVRGAPQIVPAEKETHTIPKKSFFSGTRSRILYLRVWAVQRISVRRDQANGPGGWVRPTAGGGGHWDEAAPCGAPACQLTVHK